MDREAWQAAVHGVEKESYTIKHVHVHAHAPPHTHTQCCQGPFMLWQMARFHYFLWLNYIIYIVYIYTAFLYSSINKHLGVFHILFSVNNTAMHMGLQVLF